MSEHRLHPHETGVTGLELRRGGDDGTLVGVVDHAFITTRGTFYTFAEVVLRNFFLGGGIGDFTGATGTLLIQAFADFNIGAGSGHYHGRICTGA